MNRIERARILLTVNDLNKLKKGELHICIAYFSLLHKRELSEKNKALWLYGLNQLYLVLDNLIQ